MPATNKMLIYAIRIMAWINTIVNNKRIKNRLNMTAQELGQMIWKNFTGKGETAGLSELYLNPTFANGYVTLLFPNSPKHPRQKYLLTIKGLVLYNEITSEMEK